MADDPDLTPCYTGICRICGRVVAVTVAPPTEPDVLYEALKSRKAWDRAGLVLGQCSVDDIRTGAVPLGHTPECPARKRRKKIA